MKHLPKFLILAALFLVAGWAWLQFSHPATSLRYRLTLEAEVDGKPVSVSSVVELQFGLKVDFIQKGFSQGLSQGEAVVVDFGPRGAMFALLSSEKLSGVDAPFYMFVDAFDLREKISSHNRSSVLTFASTKGRRELDFDQLPLLLRFRDIANPKTVERVDPLNLEASFGDDVVLKHAFIETTTDSVTTGIETKSSWLPDYHDKRLDGHRFGRIEAKIKLANSLASGSFKAIR